MKANVKLNLIPLLAVGSILMTGCASSSEAFGDTPAGRESSSESSSSAFDDDALMSSDLSEGLLQEGDADFSLISDRERYFLGEPIVMTATLANKSSGSLSVIPIFDPTYGFAKYTVIGPGGEREQFNPVWLDEGIARPVDLASGQSVSDSARLFLGGAGLTFDEPGVYEIEGKSHWITSSPLIIEIVVPEDEKERAASMQMLDEEVALFIFAGGGETLTHAFEVLNRVVQEFPETLMSGYANFSLGVYYSRDARDFEANAIRPADPELAASFFQESLKQPLPPYYQIQAYSLSVRALLTTGQSGPARELFEQFQKDFGGSPLARFQLEQASDAIEE